LDFVFRWRGKNQDFADGFVVRNLSLLALEVAKLTRSCLSIQNTVQALSICGAVLWLLRVIRTKKEIEKLNIPFNGSIMLQSMIARAIDNDDPAYVVISFSAFSFLFLGGLQLNYEWTYYVMIAFYGFSSLGDTIRILLVVYSATSLADVVHTSSLIDAKLRKEEATLKPSNVYEDLGRGKTIVVMVFITQVILVCFVGLDIYQTPTTNCFDGTKGCPVVGTLGSWALYVLGIFMGKYNPNCCCKL
jgi:hypothetical protein